MSYFVVMIRYPRDGIKTPACLCSDGVDPDISRSEIINRIRSGEIPSDRVAFIHFISMNDVPRDVTNELFEEAWLTDAPLSPVNRQAAQFDHARKLRAEAM